jgi:ATP-grasp domain, R2K clade family 3
MYWIVQENVKDERMYDDFLRAIREMKLDHSVVKVVPFSHETIPDVNPPAGPVICFGSVSMDHVAQLKGWKPGTFLNENFDQRIWTAKYKGYILNDDAEFYEFSKIPEFTGMRFIRPVSDMKIFSGMLVHSEEVENWKESIQRVSDSFTTLRADTMIGVSTMKDIMMEWRFFVVDGRVVTGSRYYQWGLPDHRRVDADSEAWQFAQKMVDLWQPSRGFVIDVAQLSKTAKTDEYKVIEINCLNSAGFYECDMRALVEAVERMQ